MGVVFFLVCKAYFEMSTFIIYIKSLNFTMEINLPKYLEKQEKAWEMPGISSQKLGGHPERYILFNIG